MYILAMSFASALLLLLSSFDLYAASFLTIIYNLFLSVLFCFLLYLWKVFYRFAGMLIALLIRILAFSSRAVCTILRLLSDCAC